MLNRYYQLNPKILLVMLLITALSACTFYITKSKNLDEQEEKNSILIYGYINDSEAPFTMKWAEIKQVRPATDEPYTDMRSDNEGFFYQENLTPGLYKILNVGGPEKGLSNSYYTWELPEPHEDANFKRLELVAKKPGLYFLGSYKIKKVKDGGVFGVDKYETVATKEVSEKQALQKLLTYANGTRWEKIIRAKLKKL